jgi:prolyl-tRNA synthetase
MMGALIMTHSDDEGLVIPPKLAPTQVIIVPIPKPNDALLAKANEIVAELKKRNIRVKIDMDDTKRPGFKFAEHELHGTPIRLGLGGRDLENGTIEIARRDTRTKETVSSENIGETVENLLATIQQNLFDTAKKFQQDNITKVDDLTEFKAILESKKGFISAHWDGTTETELKIKEETGATIRCIPLDNVQEDGVCILTGKPSTQRVLFARAY